MFIIPQRFPQFHSLTLHIRSSFESDKPPLIPRRCSFNPLKTRNPQTGTNSKDPDEMSYNEAFHQGLHCLLIEFQRKKCIFWKLDLYT